MCLESLDMSKYRIIQCNSVFIHSNVDNQCCPYMSPSHCKDGQIWPQKMVKFGRKRWLFLNSCCQRIHNNFHNGISILHFFTTPR